MPDVTSPLAIAFCNDDIRTAADAEAQLYYKANDILSRWSANGQNITALVPNDGTIIDDGAQAAATPKPDGRPPITGAMVWNIISRLNEHVTDMEIDTTLMTTNVAPFSQQRQIVSVIPDPAAHQILVVTANAYTGVCCSAGVEIFVLNVNESTPPAVPVAHLSAIK